ncbi:MAG: hypothetical protein ACERKZ_10355 [Lachnotalea sp.]
MKKYKMFSKIVLLVSLCGIILASINAFTGIINTSITAGGTVICIMGFIIASVAAMIIAQTKEK